MNRILPSIFLALTVLAGLALPLNEAHATSPAVLIPLQGMLTDAEQRPLNGSVTVTFSLYADATSTSPLWQETQSVSVTHGLFTTYMGSFEIIDAELLLQHRAPYMALQIEDDEEMDRWPVGHAPLAAFAEIAGDAQTLQGMTADELRQGAASVAYQDSNDRLGANNTQDAIDALLSRIEALEQQVAQAASERDGLTTTVATLADAQESAGSRLEQAESNITALQAVSNDQNSRLQQAESDLATLGFTVTSLENSVADLDNRVDAAEATVSSLNTTVTNLSTAFDGLETTVSTLNTTVANLDTAFDGLEATVNGFDGRISSLEHKTAPMNRELIRGHDAITFRSVNLHLQNGTGTTDGTVNGLGNLIVGYDEALTTSEKTGSHNIVLGRNHTYTSFGGLVGGTNNTISGPNSIALTGSGNVASKDSAVVISGFSNISDGFRSVVTGGWQNQVTGSWSVVSGGEMVSESRSDAWRAAQYASE